MGVGCSSSRASRTTTSGGSKRRGSPPRPGGGDDTDELSLSSSLSSSRAALGGGAQRPGGGDDTDELSLSSSLSSSRAALGGGAQPGPAGPACWHGGGSSSAQPAAATETAAVPALFEEEEDLPGGPMAMTHAVDGGVPMPEHLVVGRYIRGIRSVYDKFFTGPAEPGRAQTLSPKQLADACLEELTLRLSYANLEELCAQGWRGRVAPMHECTDEDGNVVGGVELGDFAVFIEGIYSVSSQMYSGAKRMMTGVSGITQEPEGARAGIEASQYQVFLGGSCHPTTWRADLVCPFLDQQGITYYNPQVDNWSPELIEIEEHAKQSSDIMFFVLTNETRGISSLVELAHLAATGRDMIVVLPGFDMGYTLKHLSGSDLTAKEVSDLRRGHEFLCSILHDECVPLFEDIPSALRYLARVAGPDCSIKNTHTDDHVMIPVFRGLRLTAGLVKTHAAFDAAGPGPDDTLPMDKALIALQEMLGCSTAVPVHYAETVLVSAGDAADTGVVTRNGFACCVADLRDALRMVLIPDPLVTSAEKREAKEVFLGGSCGAVKWRESVAMPLLAEHGVTYFNPDVEDWTTDMIPLEMAAKENSSVLLFFLSSTTRSIGTMVEAAHYVGEGLKKVVICIHTVDGGAVIQGERIDGAEASDLTRGRLYLQDLAKRKGVPVYNNVEDAIHKCIKMLATMRESKTFFPSMQSIIDSPLV